MSHTLKIFLAVFISTLITGGSVYWYMSTQQKAPVVQRVELIKETIIQHEIDREVEREIPQEKVEVEEPEISFVSCNKSLYFEQRDEFDRWRAKVSELYPNLRVYDAGSYCRLSNGHQLLSFSHFSPNGEIADAGQTIVLFDENDRVLKETKNFYCRTLGDLGYPKFESIQNNIVTMSCSSGDAGHFSHQTYELSLETFNFRATN